MHSVDDITRAITYLSTEEREAIERWIRQSTATPYRIAEPSAAYGITHNHRQFTVEEYPRLAVARGRGCPIVSRCDKNRNCDFYRND